MPTPLIQMCYVLIAHLPEYPVYMVSGIANSFEGFPGIPGYFPFYVPPAYKSDIASYCMGLCANTSGCAAFTSDTNNNGCWLSSEIPPGTRPCTTCAFGLPSKPGK